VKCPNCQSEVADTAPVCPTCDTPLDRTIFAPGDPSARTLSMQSKKKGRSGPIAAPARAEPRPPKEVHSRFLLSPVLAAPVELVERECYRIGRERSNRICFPSGHVSRVHAEVACERGRWHVCDLGSRNGTYVNGERVLKRALRDGDRIGIGDFELIFCEATKDEARRILDSSKRGAAGSDTARIVVDRDGFYGDVEKISVVEIVQLIGQNRKTGCLTIADGKGPERRLFFREGAIVHAERGEAEGEAAVHEVLRTSEGKFSFRPAAAVERVTISTPTAALLLQAAG
jgi:pSer/pThr/pTyr-binding forkhead associated (FHA) protein